MEAHPGDAGIDLSAGLQSHLDRAGLRVRSDTWGAASRHNVQGVAQAHAGWAVWALWVTGCSVTAAISLWEIARLQTHTHRPSPGRARWPTRIPTLAHLSLGLVSSLLGLLGELHHRPAM